MGSGKTLWGERLALRFQLPVYDTDSVIEQQEKSSLTDIFLRYGESHFRSIERGILLSLPDQVIVATGGGIIEDRRNRFFLQRPENLVIWLHPSWECLLKRIEKTERPIVRKLSREDLFSLWKRRLSFYEECADIILTDPSETKLYQVIEEHFR